MEDNIDYRTILDKMIELFGDNLADFEVHPRMAKFQFTLAKYHIDNKIP